MNQRLLIRAVVVIFIAVVGVGLFFLGDKHGVESMSVKRVTPDQIADAMKGDYFYSDYRENSLLVSGTVSSVRNNGSDLVVGFKTSSSYEALCDFGNSGAVFQTGQVITALSEGGSAQRQPSAVLLKDCVIP